MPEANHGAVTEPWVGPMKGVALWGMGSAKMPSGGAGSPIAQCPPPSPYSCLYSRLAEPQREMFVCRRRLPLTLRAMTDEPD